MKRIIRMRNIVTSTAEQQIDIEPFCASTQLASNIWRSFSNVNWSWQSVEVMLLFVTNQAAWCACKLAENVISAKFDTSPQQLLSNKTCTLEMPGFVNSTVYSEYWFDADTYLLN